MSIGRVDYVIVGMKFPFKAIFPDCQNDSETEQYLDKYDLYLDDYYKEAITEHDGLTLVADGMNGKYVIIGKVLRKATIDQGIDIINTAEEMPVEEFGPIALAIRKLVRKLVGDTVDQQGTMGMWVFTHWH